MFIEARLTERAQDANITQWWFNVELHMEDLLFNGILIFDEFCVKLLVITTNYKILFIHLCVKTLAIIKRHQNIYYMYNIQCLLLHDDRMKAADKN